MSAFSHAETSYMEGPTAPYPTGSNGMYYHEADIASMPNMHDLPNSNIDPSLFVLPFMPAHSPRPAVNDAVTDDCITIVPLNQPHTPGGGVPDSPSAFGGGLTSASNAHSPGGGESDPYNDSDATPATPEDLNSSTSAFVSTTRPRKSGCNTASGRLSPQPSYVRLTGGHLDGPFDSFDGINAFGGFCYGTSFVSPRDVESFSAMCTSVIDEASVFGHHHSFVDPYLPIQGSGSSSGDICAFVGNSNSNSNLPRYDPLDSGHTLRSMSSHDDTDTTSLHLQQQQQQQQQGYPHSQHTSYSAVFGQHIQQTQSPEPIAAQSLKEEDVGCSPGPRNIKPYFDESSGSGSGSSSSMAFGSINVAEDQKPVLQQAKQVKQMHQPVKRRSGATGTSQRPTRSRSGSSPSSSSSLLLSSSRKQTQMQAQTPSMAPPPKPLAPSAAIAADSSFRCSACGDSFSSSMKLRAHRKKLHDRPFTCLFAFAGCTSSFSNKNEWKRHIKSQHTMLTYWRCDDAKCERTRNSTNCTYMYGGGGSGGGGGGGGGSGAGPIAGTAYPPNDQNGSSGFFNRKDLFTQHVRRMHMPDQLKSLEMQFRKEVAKSGGQKAGGSGGSNNGIGKQKTKGKRKRGSAPGVDDDLRHHAGQMAESSSETAATAAATSNVVEEPAELKQWNAGLAALQDRSEVVRCRLPEDMTCPECNERFQGEDAWGDRLEHIASHMQASHEAGRQSWPYGGLTDPTLTDWAEDENVRIVRRCRGREAGSVRWELNKPLQQIAGGAGMQAHQENENDGDDDGEGNDDF